MAEDRHGNIWIGTAEGQLLRADGAALVSALAPTESRLISIRCLQTTSDGTLWIGYAGRGLGWLRPGRSSWIDAARGLHDNYISQIIPDGRGGLWCAGNRGIFQVALEELATLAEEKTFVTSGNSVPVS